MDSAIALNQINFNNFTEEQRWSTRRYLYNKLNSDDSTLNSNQLMSAFYDSVSTQSAGMFQDFEIMNHSAASLPLTIKILFDSISIQITSTHKSISKLDSLLYSHPGVADSLSYRVQLDSLQAQLFTLKSSLYGLLSNAFQLSSNAVSNLCVQNFELPDTSIFQSNEKLINGIYLQTFAIGNNSLSQNEKAQVFSVASQCPLSGGRSVYLARCILSTFSDTSFNDKDLCLQAGILKNSGIEPIDNTELPIFSVYPNPVSDVVTISWDIPLEGEVTFELINAVGVVSDTRLAQLKKDSYEFNVKNTPPGLYVLRIKIAGQSIPNHKLIISK